MTEQQQKVREHSAVLAVLANILSRPHWLTHMTSEGQAVPSAPWEKYLKDKGSRDEFKTI